jgi:cytoskeletal protein RodZ
MQNPTNLIKVAGVIVICATTLLVSACGGSTSEQTSSVATTSQAVTTSSQTKTNPTSTAENLSAMPDKNQVSAGDSFLINIVINSQSECRSAQVGLKFDPSQLQCTQVNEGTFFKDWVTTNGLTTLMVPATPTIDNNNGTVNTVGVAVMGATSAEAASGQYNGPQGQGVVLSFLMTVKSGAQGTAAFTITDGKIGDTEGDIITGISTTNSQVTITP